MLMRILTINNFVYIHFANDYLRRLEPVEHLFIYNDKA